MRKLFTYSLLSLAISTAPALAFEINTGLLDAAKDAGKAITLSDAEIIELGRESAAAYDEQSKVSPADSEYSKRLAKLTKKHLKEDGLNLNFKVYEDSNVNAFALPDGSIRVYSGLMDMMTDEELIGVIGHEIGHVKLQHTKTQFQKAYAASAARKGVASQGGVAGNLAKSQLVDLADEVMKAQFSQSDELGSDDYSFKFMKKHGYKREALVSSFRKLASLGDVDSITSSHPAPSKRAERLEKQL
ncbi:M48 family metallopeptidase [Motilimonas sp. E26]|uniref:M48 family metallopeptidase n=1 Tax=Motilimonas sp. E26 TaxID=2865674 RepID=UPI001E309FB8|nr:M48 family metallopeptidase [Motilimonas sp. E26]MCE0556954.1 M48 family metallopeptidase [Motilimonas sp. E26]